MEVRAIAKNVRISPEKVRLVATQIKKMKPTDAVKILDFVPNKSSKIIKKVLLSAMANARNNFGHKDESLLIDKIIISKGPVFKRYRAVARGRVHPILKRTTHIKVILEAEETKEVPKGPEVSKGEDQKSNIKKQKAK